MFTRILLILISIFFSVQLSFSAGSADINIREINIGDTGNYNSSLAEFVNPLKAFFFSPDDY